jgi:hypothetical protein
MTSEGLEVILLVLGQIFFTDARAHMSSSGLERDRPHLNACDDIFSDRELTVS